MIRTCFILFIGVILIGSHNAIVFAEQSAEELSKLALDECQKGRIADNRDVRMEHFERAEAMAERAIDVDEEYADAHFALFCSLGEQMRIDGTPSFSSIFGYNRLMSELNRTLELDPHHIDAMSSKGTLLVKLPGMLGGDSEKGEEMLHEVIKLEPSAINARLVIAQNCEGRGEHEKALKLATKALEIAKAEKRKDLIPEAEQILSDIKNK